MMLLLVFLLLCCYTSDHYVSANASHMIGGYCSRALGSTIMGQMSVTSTERSIQIYRNNVLVSDNSYVSGEQLKIQASSTSSVFFETSAGTFSGPSVGCSNKRTTTSGNMLTMPSSGDVVIKIGWASGYGQVKYTTRTLSVVAAPLPTPLPTTAPPTSIPTASPTLSPTTAPPTPIPTTALPTASPTPLPTSSPTNPTTSPTLSPTYEDNRPTPSPSYAPSNSPTLEPTYVPTRIPTYVPTYAPTPVPTTAIPTVAPTFVPTRIPTHVPTYSPTLVPTPSTYTSVSFEVSEKIGPVPADIISTTEKENQVKIALEDAIISALKATHSNLVPYNFYISSIAVGSAIMRRISLQSNSLSYDYSCQFILELTPFGTSSALYTSVSSSISSGTYETSVVNDLRTNSGISSFSSVNSVDTSSINYKEESVTINPMESTETVEVKKNDSKVGIIFGSMFSIGILLVGFGAYNYFLRKSQKKNFEDIEPDAELRKVKFLFLSAILLSLASLILVVTWAKNNNYDSMYGDTNYLGSLDWKKNIFAWHPVLMVGGFFVAQVIAPAMWVVFPDSYRAYAKVLHIMFQTGGVITMSIGLYASFEAKRQMKSPHLVSLHSWIGIGAIGMYLLNYIYGALMRPLSVIFGKGVGFVLIHRKGGLIAFGLTVASILTGIVLQLPRGVCNYTSIIDKVENSFANYGEIPASCRIANSLGLVVISSSLITVIATVKRSRILQIVNVSLVNIQETRSRLSKSNNPSLVIFTIACFLSIASLIFVLRWAKNNNYDSMYGDTNYLGSLDWKKNIFAWHPVLMVGGFFVAQVIAPAIWVVFPDSYRAYAKVLHIMFQTGGVITMSIGLYASFEAKRQMKSPHLVSLHSWIGIGAIGMYLLNYIYGALMSLVLGPKGLEKLLDLKFNHSILGLSALGLTSCGIVTGISAHVLRGACNIDNNSCRISSITGILVVAGSVLVAVAASIRNKSLDTYDGNAVISNKRVVIPSAPPFSVLNDSHTEEESNIRTVEKYTVDREIKNDDNNSEESNDDYSLSYLNPVTWFCFTPSKI